MASLYHPVSTKYIVSNISPIQWAGGQALEMYKNKGAMDSSKSYRDILLADVSSKPFMRAFRKRLRFPLNSTVHELQFGGGCNNGSTSMAHLNARAQ
eukprot:5970157-Karenia_brevis.AAC.1